MSQPYEQFLYTYMSTISEDCYCAGWMDGLEYALWSAVIYGPMSYGMGVITSEQCQALKELSEASGGWWTWNWDDREPRFVDIEVWKEIYSADLLERERIMKMLEEDNYGED